MVKKNESSKKETKKVNKNTVKNNIKDIKTENSKDSKDKTDVISSDKKSDVTDKNEKEEVILKPESKDKNTEVEKKSDKKEIKEQPKAEEEKDSEISKEKKPKAEAETKPSKTTDYSQERMRLLFSPTKYPQNNSYTDLILEEKPLPEIDDENILVLLPIDPYKVNAYWNLKPDKISHLKSIGARKFILRIYDITGMVFDGYNAHRYWDFKCKLGAPNWYVPAPADRCDLCAELGYTTPDNFFVPIVRSNTIFIPPKEQSPIVEDKFVIFKDHEPEIEEYEPQPFYELHEKPEVVEEIFNYDPGLGFQIFHKEPEYEYSPPNPPAYIPPLKQSEPPRQHFVAPPVFHEEEKISPPPPPPVVHYESPPASEVYFEQQPVYVGHELSSVYEPGMTFFREYFKMPIDVMPGIFREVYEKYGVFPIYSSNPEFEHIMEVYKLQGPEVERYKEIFAIKTPEIEYFREVYYPQKPLFEHFKVMFELREPFMLHEVIWDKFPPKVEIVKEYYDIHEKTYLISMGWLPTTKFFATSGSEGMWQRFLGASEMRFMGASERWMARYPGASERFLMRQFLGSSEWMLSRYPGASERWSMKQFIGASERWLARYPGASERLRMKQFIGASEFRFIGASERRFLGASERWVENFIGESERFFGASERWLVPAGASEKWMKKFAGASDLSYEEISEEARTKSHIFSSKYYI